MVKENIVNLYGQYPYSFGRKSKLIAHTFENGKVKVTFTGEEKIMFDGEHHEWVSNEWQYINKKGESLH